MPQRRLLARNHRNGRTILYRRHVSLVVARDWPIRMDLFTSTVAASAGPRRSRDVAAQRTTHADTNEPIIAAYLQPFPAPPDHLDATTTSAPRPQPHRPGSTVG
ncbi:MAG: hypothetical protein HKP61_21640 [Dactylosporangium sp.]|nr:hypothetical protein [Dactylosporangium sp.]NNJ63486.1 hypothetical protein [Dactylosporangium sp.]